MSRSQNKVRKGVMGQSAGRAFQAERTARVKTQRQVQSLVCLGALKKLVRERVGIKTERGRK